MTLAMPLYAQNAPEPKQAPPRVPFSAFRMKPILDPKLQAEQEAAKSSGSVVVPDNDVKAKPTPKLLGTLPIAKPKPQVIKVPPVKLKVETVEAPQNLPQSVKLLGNDDKARVPNARVLTADTGLRVTPKGLPLPPLRKPDAGNFDAAYIPPEPMPEPQAAEIVPPEPVIVESPQASQEAEIIPPEPMTQEEIANAPTSVRRNRFSAQSRMAGLDVEYGTARTAGIPDSMSGLRVGKLEEDEGVSPVVIPRVASVPHAPEMDRAAQQKIPPEVIVFFQENSDELEAGQFDIIKADVVALLKERRDLEVEIIGYANAMGGDKGTAQKLSQERALMIRNYLVKQKIDSGRIQVTGKANNTKIEPRDRADLFFSR